MYKNGTGEPELFDADAVPKTGFADSPKAAMGKAKPAAKKAAAKKPDKKRARKGGKFVADDPSTPDVNEAFEQEVKAPMPADEQRVAQRSVGLRRLGGKLVG